MTVMAKIDTSSWKEFIVGELFPNMVKPSVLHMRQVVETDEGIRYVVRTKFNNGIKCRVNPVEGVEPSPAGVITWGAENASFFYQEEAFLSGRDIYYVDTREYSANICMFLAACLQTIAFKYPYNFGLFPELLKDERIMLPVDSEDNPDWMYMEKYMQKILNEVDINIENLKKVKEKPSVVDIKEWKDFVFGEVFEIQPQKEVSPIYALNNSQKSDVLYPFLGQSSENNCIISYIYLDDEVLLNNKEKDIAIIIHSNNHLSFCIDEPFYLKDGHGATSIFKNNNLNIYNVRFIIAVLNKTMENLFNYDVKATKYSLKTMIVKLPVTFTGEPDWNYMEQCMKKEMNISEKIIGNFELLNIC